MPQNKDIPHYDLTGRMRKRALIAGAKEISSAELVRIWREHAANKVKR